MDKDTGLKEPFYTPTPNPMGKVDNRINDSEVAHGLANIEATQGVNAALARENLLRSLDETGLTPEQRELIDANTKVVEGLREKYPDSWESRTDKNGHTMLVLKKGTAQIDQNIGSELVYTDLGLVNLWSQRAINFPLKDFDLTPLEDRLLRYSPSDRKYFLGKEQYVRLVRYVHNGIEPYDFTFMMNDLSDPLRQAKLKTLFTAVQEEQSGLKANHVQEAKPLNPADILNNL